MSNVIELRLLDHCVHPMCYVMDVMTNLRQYYSNSHKITKREHISNPFEVLERQTLDVENIDEKNKYLTILFFSQLYTHLHTCQKSHPDTFVQIRTMKHDRTLHVGHTWFLPSLAFRPDLDSIMYLRMLHHWELEHNMPISTPRRQTDVVMKTMRWSAISDCLVVPGI